MSIILHNFDTSPFAENVRLIFGLKDLAWQSVEVGLVMPKPKLTTLSGGYRKTPVMQIGADIYCDSRLIVTELEERFPTPTIFPYGSRGLCMALSSWSDKDLHISSSGLVIGVNRHEFPADLMADRKAFFQGFMDVDRLDADIPHSTTQLRAHADLIDQQLSNGRLFWLGQEPSLADFHAYVEIWTARAFVPFAEELFSSFTHMCEWEARVRAIGNGQRSVISAEQALRVALDSEPLPGGGVDSHDVLQLDLGEAVVVTPDDYGHGPVTGRLVTLTTREVAVARDDPRVGNVVVHFPRIGFRISKAEN